MLQHLKSERGREGESQQLVDRMCAGHKNCKWDYLCMSFAGAKQIEFILIFSWHLRLLKASSTHD